MARRPLLAGSLRGISTARAVPADPHLADRADPHLADRADQVVPETTARADRAAQACPRPMDRAGLADLQASDQADRVVPARGMEMPSTATSTELRGVADPRRGALVRHRGRTGVGPFRHPVDRG
jgi:hypothetical protein